ncbi:MAG: serine/threonine-protein kinase, partial [Myxococcota bacterium]
MQPGDVIEGKYKIEAKLGQGSFGAVYRATQTSIGRTVAIKVLIPRSQNDDELRHRFRREAKLSSQLNSPHTINIHDFGTLQDNRMYIVMEFLEGMPLDRLIKKEKRLAPARAARIAQQTLLSLGEAHALGIVHRDLKPENIFICDNMPTPDYVKVFDFGIAKVVTGGKGGTLKETAKLTMAGGTVGTPAYMSPEQCYGKQLTGSSDLYSLGIVMYEMVTGRLPFENANPVQTMMRQINDPPPPLPPEIAETKLGQAIIHALEKKPENRFKTA